MTNNQSTSGKTDRLTARELCLTWGLPGVVMFIISLLLTLAIGTEFNHSFIAEAGIFLATFVLQMLIYYMVFQSLPQDMYTMFHIWKEKRRMSKTPRLPLLDTVHDDTNEHDDNDESDVTSVTHGTLPSQETDVTPTYNVTDKTSVTTEDNETEATDVTSYTPSPVQTDDTAVTETAVTPVTPEIPVIPQTLVLTTEQYTQRNIAYQAKLEAEKARLVNAILKYVHYTMSCFIREENMPSFCEQIVCWTKDPGYVPTPAKLKVALTSIELRHFIWNIGERLGKVSGYDGNARAYFAKALFKEELKDVSIDTIKNFTVDADKGRIKIDRPKPDSYEFHYSGNMTEDSEK